MPFSFTDLFYKQGRSPLFLAGIILFTFGSLVTTAINFGQMLMWTGILSFLNWFAILPVPFLFMLIFSLWLIYVASVERKSPEKIFTALTLVKIHTIVYFAIYSVIIIAAITGLILFAVMEHELFNFVGVYSDIWTAVFFIVIIITLIIIIPIYIVYLVFYFIALLRALKGIRNGIKNNIPAPVRGVIPFSVVSFIIVSFSVLSNLSSLSNAGSLYFYYDLMNEFPSEFWDIFNGLPFHSTGIIVASALSSIISSTGVALIIITLLKFNSSLKQKQQY